MNLFLKAAQYEPKTPNEHVEGVSLILPLEGRNGFVFAMAYIAKKHVNTEDLLLILSDQSHRLAESFGKDANAQHRFEQFLGALNETIAQAVREGRILLPINAFHASVGIICEGQMFLSGAGELAALFLHKKPSQRYQIFNLFRSIQTEQALPSWEKPFAVVLDGNLEPGDVFCVSNKDLQQAISTDDLHSTLITLPPKSAVEKIRQYFAHNDGMLLIILKMDNTEQFSLETVAKPRGNVSVDSMIRTQQETSHLLEDQKPQIGTYIWQKIRQIIRTYTSRSRILSDLSKSDSKFKVIWRVVKLIARATWKILKHGFKKIVFTILFVSKKEKRAEVVELILKHKRNLKQSLFDLLDRIKRLPKKTRISLFIAIGAFIILIIGLIFLSRSHSISTEQKRYEKQITKIEELIDQASGALIYKDENQARTLFKQAQDLLDSLPKNKPDRIKQSDKISSEIETAMNELRRVILVPNPAITADLDQIIAGISGTSILSIESELYVSGSDQQIYRLDRLQKKFTPLTKSQLPSQIFDMSTNDSDLYIFDASRNVLQINKDTGDATTLSLAWDHQNWKDVIMYANRLYAIQSSSQDSENQIIRFNKSGETFGDGKTWISSRASTLSNAVSLMIDGSLYVLKEDGTVSRFENGSETGWTLEMIEPPLTNPTRIWTTTNSAHIYIIEPKTNRLVVFEKRTGRFVTQFKSDLFTDLKGVSVDEKDYTIYLLAGSKLYSIAASHLTSK